MDQRARDRLDLEADLRAALDRHEFELHYQPILDLETGAIRQLEALVRWNHPRRGMLPPAAFISLAEQTGLIVTLGEWIRAEACRQVADWHHRYQLHPAIEVSVNLSALQLRQADLVARVTRTLDETGLSPWQLRLEITESSMVHDPNSAIATLQSLRAVGVQLAVDDFGTGFATFSSFKQLPVDSLKIDRSFVSGLQQDPQDTAIVHAVIAFGKMLGLRVTGEGIETAGQIEQLRALGCDYGQGYYFARPLPSNGIESMLEGSDQANRRIA
jgi:EAL domain-containing protein (putative c-di-GMP-specific phosphodiesterase class I)